MTKPQTYQTSAGHDGPNPDQREHKHGGGPEPLSGSKKVKNRNHVSHNNPEGS
ncbi:small acid-soluble spore protein P [Paenibacillus puldeungensis]|uniref:Small acid-soluble spore protein P n=1 Tax=Paenibacillus puldeungensis TaxID=696536 RepID=A0ABW3S3N7_9BACL